MPMERSQPSDHHESPQKGGLPVVAIECLRGGGDDRLLRTGDIVEEIKIRGSAAVRAPFKGGKGGVQKVLHGSFKRGETSITVRARRGRGREAAEMQAYVVPDEAGGRRSYVLRAIRDPNYAVGFVDRYESECFALEGSRSKRVVCALSKAPIQDGYIPYAWERKMKESLPVSNSSCFISILFLPKSSDRVATQYNDLEDTLARANAWLSSSHASGVPIAFMNLQTEALLTKISGDTASSTVSTGSLSDLSNLANTSLYGFEDYHGVDIGVVRAVRLWFAPLGGEISVEIKLLESDTKLGFAISRTEEGFIYISSVMDDDDDRVASSRSGLRELYQEAEMASKLLVVSRLCNKKVLPWLVSSTGAIRCFDTVSLSQKLSLHRHALSTITIHFLMWDRPIAATAAAAAPVSAPSFGEMSVAAPQSNKPSSPPPSVGAVSPANLDQEDMLELRLDRDTAGDASFRFHDFALPNNWV
ncbi:hypothetical protein QJS10_CPB22g01446 [Acorus calamus]|uniref:Uncharacterized protein n=1 Tax=Acorus calamus TaxID=4465 RepID=A0AAV9C113_ACOCL|nr:hypothetical protein QJS10_CPB22g01432 [Acorus calamus]KAK1282551.1 hypothetical protein QJS10_CPB22g01446 [Acorus calamus]